MPEPPLCCLCDQPCEPWPTPEREGRIHGYGHNPEPLGLLLDDRCCNFCNETQVIPARLRNLITRKNN